MKDTAATPGAAMSKTRMFGEKAELLAFQAKRYSMDIEWLDKIKPIIERALEEAYQKGLQSQPQPSEHG